MVVFIGLHENLMRFLNHKILNCLAIFSFSVFYSSRGALFLSFFPTLSLSLSLTFLLSHSPFLFFLFLSLFTHCHPLISHSFPFLSLFSIYSYPTFVLFSLSIHFLSLPYFLTLYLPLFSLSLSYHFPSSLLLCHFLLLPFFSDLHSLFPHPLQAFLPLSLSLPLLTFHFLSTSLFPVLASLSISIQLSPLLWLSSFPSSSLTLSPSTLSFSLWFYLFFIAVYKPFRFCRFAVFRI